MINSARAEPDVQLGRGGDASLAMTERESSEEGQRGAVMSESGSEGGYDDDYDTLDRERSSESATLQKMRKSKGYESRR